jgi:glyoxylase-like metal-dependent hydrolase (beta-lactamase superfamily II)
MTWKTLEVAPGITRIESILGPRPFSQYLLHDERSMLVDTGVKETPPEVILPALDGTNVDFVLVSHADVDHFGGNAAIHQAMPEAIFCASVLDTPWIEDVELIMRERYGWYDAFGVGYDPDTAAWLENAMGPPLPIDMQLQGGEVFRLGPRLCVEILPLPGHSPGHLGVWEPLSRTAIVIDAVLAGGLLDTVGHVIHPPPIVDVAGYEKSVRLLQELDPAQLLTAHYDVIQGDDVGRFLDESLAFIARVREFVAASPDISLAELLAGADAELGPFTSMSNELAATLRSVLLEQGRTPLV